MFQSQGNDEADEQRRKKYFLEKRIEAIKKEKENEFN